MLMEWLSVVRMSRVLHSCWGWIALDVPKISVNSPPDTGNSTLCYSGSFEMLNVQMKRHLIENLKYDSKLGTISHFVKCFSLYFSSWELEVCVWALLLNQCVLLKYLRKIIRITKGPDVLLQSM